MQQRQIGDSINIGWPDFGRPEQAFTIVDLDQLGQVFRARVIGFREGEARSICTILRNRGLPCAPVRAGVVSVAAIPTD